jgi:hypothetical protein
VIDTPRDPDIYRPGGWPTSCPCVRTEEEASAAAFQYGDILDGIEVYRDGYLVRLESVLVDDRPNGEVRETLVPTLPEKLADMDRLLAAKGLNVDPATGKGMGLSPWWRKQIARMYFTRDLGDGTRRKEMIVRGGRRSGKSISVCLIALYETLHGQHTPTLDTSIFLFLSAEKPQAVERIQTIRKFCELLGIESLGIDARGLKAQKIEFKKLGRAIEAHTASLTSVVSMTAYGACCDEEALWGNDAEGTDPADQILEQLRPTMLTQPNAWLFHVSAPWSTLDEHYKAFEHGTDNIQIAWHCPSWVGNPTVSKEETRKQTRDPMKWQRQYAAIPLSSDETKFFPKPFVDMATVRRGEDFRS